MSSDRRGQAQSSLRNVKERHDAIQKIERQMVELAQLFQDLDQIVMQQEPLVENIEQKGEEIHSNVVQANTEIGGAIEKARSRNRKKWWCLLIVGEWIWSHPWNISKLTSLSTHHYRHCCCGSSGCYYQQKIENQKTISCGLMRGDNCSP